MNSLPCDHRDLQALRAADCLEQYSDGLTAPELQSRIDCGSASKLLSVMEREMGYRFKRVKTHEVCVGGTKQRRRIRYILLSRPNEKQGDLFPAT
jgi:hypothetical protein